MAARVRFNVNAMTAHELIRMLRSGELVLPPHQREYCWDVKRQGYFVRSVVDNIPTQSIIMRKVVGRGAVLQEGDQTSLEDGHQRLTTIMKFMSDELSEDAIKWAGCSKFGEMTAAEKADINAYQFSVIIYRGATTEQMVTIFDHFQNGLPLTKGERLHSMSEISPLVSFVKRQLMTADQGLHNRSAIVWGVRSGTDKRRKALLNATALCAGLAFGPEGFTKKWADYVDKNYLSREIDAEDLLSKLNTLLDIYEQVDARTPMRNRTVLNNQWDVGKYSGYIGYSLNTYPDDRERLVNGWVNFLAGARTHPERIRNILHYDDGTARSWNTKRWQMGYLRVFHPAEARRLRELAAPAHDVDDPSESDGDESDD